MRDITKRLNILEGLRVNELAVATTKLDFIVQYMKNKLRMDFILVGDAADAYSCGEDFKEDIIIYVLNPGILSNYADYVDYNGESFKIEGIRVYITSINPITYKTINGIKVSK